MHRKFLFILVLALLTYYGCSRFYYQPPLAKFNHEGHVSVLFEKQKDCTYCHNLSAIEALIQQWGVSKKDPELIDPKLIDRKLADRKLIDTDQLIPNLKIDDKCHSCHKDKATKTAEAPQRCDTCHENMKTMKPDDHLNNWKRMHSVPAGLDKKECVICHQNWYCESCHSQQRSLDNRMHSRTFKLRHSLEALVDPGSCDTCHRVSFCIDCHLKE